MAFCKDYNEKTASQAGTIVPVEITVFEDRSFTYVLKTPPVSDLLKKALGVDKGSPPRSARRWANSRRDKIREIAEIKMRDLNTTDVEAAMRMVEGTARSMGIEVK